MNNVAKIAVLTAIMASSAHAAVWERPAGGYTPTNHSVNITKYQIDSANHTAISAMKVDGDMNKAFQGLNSLESRVPPSVSGQEGKFLTNDGENTSWSLVSPASIDGGDASAGEVLTADGSGAATFGLLDESSFPANVTAGTYLVPTLTLNTAGIVTAVTSTQVISVSTVNISSSLIVSGSAAISGSLAVSGSVTISGTIGGVAGKYVSKAWVNMNGSGGCSVVSQANVASCTRISTGNYGISFTTPMADANYAVSCTARGGPSTPGVAVLSGESGTVGKSTTGFGMSVVGNFSYAKQDSTDINCLVFGN